jgi:hypothetical protein
LLHPDQITQDAPPALRRVQFVGYLAYFALMVVLAALVVRGYAAFGSPWRVLLAVLAGYLAADLASGFVHFLADNFGDPATPFIGPSFVLPFRQHHVDPLGITRHGFFAANASNALVCVPVLAPVVLFVPITSSPVGYVSGVFTLVMLFAVFLTNQTHKWAHMHNAPPVVRWLQSAGVILSKSHHDIHHQRPYNTHYCITVGAWNRLFERLNAPDRLERFIRRHIPGTDPRLRVQQELADTEMGGNHSTN